MRDFEKEYKNYINEETPDLWDRIESRLPEKNGIRANEAAGNTEAENKEEKNKEVKNTETKDVEIKDSEIKNTETKDTEIKNAEIKDIKTVGSRQKILYLMKRSMPAVAALCVLLIGFGAIRLSDRSKSNTASYEEAAEVTEDAAYEAEADDVYYETDFADESPAEAPVMEAFPDAENSLYDDIMQSAGQGVAGESAETAGVADASMSVAETAETSDMAANDSENRKTETAVNSDSGGTVKLEEASLTGIEMADADLQDEGFTYIYRFRLEEGKEIEVYLTQAQCDALDKSGVTVMRQLIYDLEVEPYSATDSADESDHEKKEKEDFSACTLVKMKLH